MRFIEASCCNFGRSPIHTHVIPILVLFLHFLTTFLFYWLSTYFEVPQPKDGKNQLNSQSKNFMLNLLRKKFINKIKYSRSSPDPDFLGVTISIHVIYFWFLPFSRHLQTTQENQNWSIRRRRISGNWAENSSLSQKERFLEPIKKISYIVNYLWAGVYGIILVITKIYIFSSLFHLSFVIEAKATFLDCADSNIYSCILSLLKLHETFWFMN